MHRKIYQPLIAMLLLLIFSVAALAQGADAKAKAQEVLKAARAAIGSESKLNSLQSLTASGSARRTFGDFQMESELVLDYMAPDKIKKTENSQRGTQVNALNGDQIWNDFVPAMGGGGGFRFGGPGGGPGGPGGGQNNPMAGYFQLQQRREMYQIMIAMFLQAPASARVDYTYVGEAQGPNGKVDVLDGVGEGGFMIRLYIDQESHQLVGMSYKAKSLQRAMRRPGQGGPGGPGAGQPGQGRQGAQQGQPGQQRPQMTDEEREKRRQEMMEAFAKAPDVDYRWAVSDYKSVGGLNLPHRITKLEAGTANEEWEISKYKINPKLTADKFEKK